MSLIQTVCCLFACQRAAVVRWTMAAVNICVSLAMTDTSTVSASRALDCALTDAPAKVGYLKLMRLFSEIGGATLEGAGSGRSCQNISKCILYLWKLLSCGGQFFLHISTHSL